ADDYLHLWSYVGELLGVHPDLLPLDREAARELMEQVRRRQFGPSPAGALLGVSERFGRGMLMLAVDAERGGDRAAFEIPEELGRSLGVGGATGGRAG